ncbi:hypothetical protein DEU37_2899 [Microbacterium sp. AG790]|uniref:hypothetical protein n=1 Tax=Microbacterium sp. AG790 TaxID=2183995 RepID=UPI000F1BED1C|nr:hypothetical protein [Microbacterium sp. AG790]RKS84842.1 hypothetical protein DEU37_2899 [Microbacterium sp. AG790]
MPAAHATEVAKTIEELHQIVKDLRLTARDLPQGPDASAVEDVVAHLMVATGTALVSIGHSLVALSTAIVDETTSSPQPLSAP